MTNQMSVHRNVRQATLPPAEQTRIALRIYHAKRRGVLCQTTIAAIAIETGLSTSIIESYYHARRPDRNPHAHNVGCLVPRCKSDECNRAVKARCALRRYFLLDQIEKRKLERTLRERGAAPETMRRLRREINYWRSK